jgi:hypothetical protein
LKLEEKKDAEEALTAYFEEAGGKKPRYYPQAAEAGLYRQPRIMRNRDPGSHVTVFGGEME